MLGFAALSVAASSFPGRVGRGGNPERVATEGRGDVSRGLDRVPPAVVIYRAALDNNRPMSLFLRHPLLLQTAFSELKGRAMEQRSIGRPSSKVTVNVQAGWVTELLMWPTPNP